MLLAVASFVTAAATTLILLAWPCAYVGIEATSSGAPEGERVCATLVEMNGPRVIWLLVVPVLLTVVGAVMAWLRLRTGIWLSAALVLVFCVAGVFTIGLWYVPAAVALFFAAGSSRGGRRRALPGA